MTPPISTDKYQRYLEGKKRLSSCHSGSISAAGQSQRTQVRGSQPSAGLVTPLTIPPHADDRMAVFAMGLQCPPLQPLCDENCVACQHTGRLDRSIENGGNWVWRGEGTGPGCTAGKQQSQDSEPTLVTSCVGYCLLWVYSSTLPITTEQTRVRGQ